MSVTAADVEAAARTIAGKVRRTRCEHSEALSALTATATALKYENEQYAASFKVRGAYNKLVSLDEPSKRRGVVAMSAGNHAQGVAFHAQRLGIPATIVMPRLTPTVKVEQTRRFGARVVLDGDDLEAASEAARALERAEGLTFIHPYDDDRIIAGQGTVALEMLADDPELEVLVVPIGGGGLIAGMAIAAKAQKPAIELIGVEAALFPSVLAQLRGYPAPKGGVTIAEGIAVKAPGKRTLPVIRDLVAEVLLVEEAAIETAILMLLEAEKTVVEGAGAAGLAALLSYRERFAGKRVGLVLCGGNIDSRLLSQVTLRGLVRSQRLVRLRVAVPDVPGSLARVATLLAEAGGNVIDVQHQRAFSSLSVKATAIDFVIETRGPDHAAAVLADLKLAGFDVARLDDERTPGA